LINTNGVEAIRARTYNNTVCISVSITTPRIASNTVVQPYIFQSLVTSATNNLANPERNYVRLWKIVE